MYIRSSIPCKVAYSGNSEILEYLFITFKLNNKSYGVGCLYKPSNSNVLTSLDLLGSIMLDVLIENDEVVSIGNLNLYLLSIGTTNVDRLYSLCDKLGVTQVVDEASRITKYSSALMDMVLDSDVLLVTDLVLVDM